MIWWSWIWTLRWVENVFVFKHASFPWLSESWASCFEFSTDYLFTCTAPAGLLSSGFYHQQFLQRQSTVMFTFPFKVTLFLVWEMSSNTCKTKYFASLSPQHSTPIHIVSTVLEAGTLYLIVVLSLMSQYTLRLVIGALLKHKTEMNSSGHLQIDFGFSSSSSFWIC